MNLPQPRTRKNFSLIGLGALAFKLFKSVKVIKVALLGLSAGAYSLLFSWQFAAVLLACIVFHEYGHIRAMRYFGMKTKGIYLIPFVGGLAVTDQRIETRWQDVTISIMGPVFGLLLSLAAALVYVLTGQVFWAAIASFNAFINIFNLLPIMPLDGGRIIKSIAFSLHGIVGFAAAVVGLLVGIFFLVYFKIYLLVLLLIIGLLDLIGEWRIRGMSPIRPMNAYACQVAFAWYALVLGGLIAIIWQFASIEGLGIPLMVLSS